jgi:amphi-Trp domain-containing protein
MPEFKFEKKEVLTRKEAAGWLSAIAKALSSGDEFELERGGGKLKMDVADKVMLEIEVEIDDHETELEIEIKWPTSPKAPERPKPTAAAKRRTRGRATPAK